MRELALVVTRRGALLPAVVGLLVGAIALDTTAETYKTPLSFPWPPQFGNFSTAWNTGGQGALAPGLATSLIITCSSVVAVIVLGSLCAYTLARRRGRLSNLIYTGFAIGIILPYQLAIIPLFVAMLHLGLVGNYLGMIVLNTGLLMPLTVFLYTGFIRALPRDYEEAARVDGAGILRTYARVVFPLLLGRSPPTAAGARGASSIWNEFFIALIFLIGSQRPERFPASRSTRSSATTPLAGTWFSRGLRSRSLRSSRSTCSRSAT